MKMLTNQMKPTKALKMALGLHLIFLLCAGFLAIPKKEKPPEHLFELVSAPPPAPEQLDLPEIQPESTPPPPEPEPQQPEPKPVEEPPPPKPESKPEPKPQPKPVVKKKLTKPEPKPEPIKKVKKDPPKPVKKVTPAPKKRTTPTPVKNATPRPTPTPAKAPQVKVNLPSRTQVKPTNTPVVPTRPVISQADMNRYLQQFYGLLRRHWKKPPEGFLANREVIVQFTISPNGRLQSYKLIRRSGDAQLDSSIINALSAIRSSGITLPPPGRKTGTFEITFKPG